METNGRSGRMDGQDERYGVALVTTQVRHGTTSAATSLQYGIARATAGGGTIQRLMVKKRNVTKTRQYRVRKYM